MGDGEKRQNLHRLLDEHQLDRQHSSEEYTSIHLKSAAELLTMPTQCLLSPVLLLTPLRMMHGQAHEPIVPCAALTTPIRSGTPLELICGSGLSEVAMNFRMALMARQDSMFPSMLTAHPHSGLAKRTKC
jgi:hypothetical protein